MGTKVFAGALAALLLVVLVYSTASMFRILRGEDTETVTHGARVTAFDRDYATRRMDADGDGQCDLCGMTIEQCIASGMLECTMDPEARIGLLGSAHIHADIAVFDGGRQMELWNDSFLVRSSFVHVERESDPAATGRLLHLHAKGVPLSLFLESIGLALQEPRLLVNGKETDLATYVPEHRDQILLTTSAEERLQEELAAVTNFSARVR